MPFKGPRQSLVDILERIDLIQASAAGQDVDTLRQNHEKRAVIERWLLVIAEAATRLGGAAFQVCPGPDWRNIRGLGNVIRHEYDGVDLYQMWNVITRDLPPLREQILRALEMLDKAEPQAEPEPVTEE